MTAPRVTVLIPAYNAAAHLPAALTAVRAQDYADLEILVIDDGSTDDTPALLAAVDDPRLRVITQHNTGLVGALNRGIEEARGELIARMDADDLIPRWRIGAQVRALDADPALVVVGTDYAMFGAVRGRVRLPRTDRACRRRLALASSHCGASVVMRRNVLWQTGIRFRSRYAHAEDYRMWTELAEHGRLGNIGGVGYHYRMHAGQVSRVHQRDQRRAHLAVAADYARRSGIGPVPPADLERLLWTRPETPLAALGAVAGPALRATAAAPGVETARFCARTVYEAVVGAVVG